MGPVLGFACLFVNQSLSNEKGTVTGTVVHANNCHVLLKQF